MNIREYLMEKQAAKRVGIFRRIARNYNDAAKKIGVTGELAVASGTAALASGTIGRYLNENKKDRATAIGAGVAGATAPIAGASLALDGLRNPAKSSFKKILNNNYGKAGVALGLSLGSLSVLGDKRIAHNQKARQYYKHMRG